MHRPIASVRAALSAFLVALLIVSVADPVLAQSDPEAQREDVRQQAADVAAEVDALEADTAKVVEALDVLQANVAALNSQLADAQLAADQAAAAVQAAIAEQVAAQARVDMLQDMLREIAIDSYVTAGTVSLDEEPTGGNVDEVTLRNALAGFKAQHDQAVLEEWRAAQRDLAQKRAAAEAASAAAEARRAEVATRAQTAYEARDQQAAFARQVQRRLDSKLAEARSLAALDRKLSAQIDAEARTIADRVGGGATTRPPPPPGNWPVPPPPGPPPVLATTHGITVAASIVEQVNAMLNQAVADGMKFTGSGWRSYESQVQLRRAHCGTTNYDIYYRPASECSPPTARPGYSMHEQGLAIDFAESGSALTSHDDRGYKWLAANAATYGFKNLDSEPWHWSVNGS